MLTQCLKTDYHRVSRMPFNFTFYNHPTISNLEQFYLCHGCEKSVSCAQLSNTPRTRRLWECRDVPGHNGISTRCRRVISFTARPIYPRGKTADTEMSKEWLDPRDCLDLVAKTEFMSCRGTNMVVHVKLNQ